MEYVIELELPDGYSWFGGIIEKKVKDPRTNQYISMPMNFWTPYEKEALTFDNREKAEELNNKMLADAGGIVVPVTEANFRYAYKQLPNGEFIGAKRVCNLCIGDLFKKFETDTATFKVVKYLDNNTKILCVQSHKGEENSHGALTFGAKSRKWVYVLYKPIPEPKNN
jgi:hypothetical protein